jgi:hypothetical protein
MIDAPVTLADAPAIPGLTFRSGSPAAGWSTSASAGRGAGAGWRRR